MAQSEVAIDLSALRVLRMAARLLRQLANWGEVNDETAGRLARDLTPDQWSALDASEREAGIQAGCAVLGVIRDNSRLPIIRRGDAWIWTAGKKPVHCSRCGRVLGFATEDHALRIILPTISQIEIESGVIRCTCGQERIWRACNPN
jgi:hypothetical protein